MQTNLVLWAKPTQEPAVPTERVRNSEKSSKEFDHSIERGLRNLENTESKSIAGNKKEVEPEEQNAQAIALDLLRAAIPVIKEVLTPINGAKLDAAFDADSVAANVAKAIENYVTSRPEIASQIAFFASDVDAHANDLRCGTDLLYMGARPTGSDADVDSLTGSRPLIANLAEQLTKELATVTDGDQVAPILYNAILKSLESNMGQRLDGITGAKPMAGQTGAKESVVPHPKVLATLESSRLEKVAQNLSEVNGSRPATSQADLTAARPANGAKPIQDAAQLTGTKPTRFDGSRPTWSGDMRDWMKKADTGERSPLQFSTQNLAPVSTQTTGPASILNTQSSVASAIDASVAQLVQSISHQQPATPESLAQMVTSMISRNNIVARQATGTRVDEVDADLLLTKGGQPSTVGVAQLDGTPSDTSDAHSQFGQRPQNNDGFAIAFGREPSDDPTLDLVEDVSSEAKEVDSMLFETNRVDARDVKSARVMTRDQVASAVANRMSDVHQAIHDLAQARNGGQMSIRLTPEDLGTIDVGVKVFGQKIDIDIQATDERVRTNLTVHRQELVQSVESKGLSLGSLNVGQHDSSDAQQQARDERFIDRQDFARAHAMSHKEPESTIMQHRDRSKFLVGAVDYQA